MLIFGKGCSYPLSVETAKWVLSEAISQFGTDRHLHNEKQNVV